MSNWAIRVKGLGKRYRIGQRSDVKRTRWEKFGALASGIAQSWRAKADQTDDENTIWALNDVNFDVAHGEVIGVIGRNGSGKSTLLKILARITSPSHGEIELYGRLGALLEVGTGFHPELTGRENIYLNGTLLGMASAEIDRKFDAIVQFSEVERFIDTPVKRYSSGMYVRLAFAVAAHLESEILILDEVLAVGDQAFQRKCLGKVGDVAKGGKTVLIVSHNLPVIQNTCRRGILFDQGKLLMDRPLEDVVAHYSDMGLVKLDEKIWGDNDKAPHFEDRSVRVCAARAVDLKGEARATFDVNEPFFIEVEYRVLEQKHALNAHLYFRNDFGQNIFVTMDNQDTPWKGKPTPSGLYRARCQIPAGLLSDGIIRIECLVGTNPSSVNVVAIKDALVLTIVDEIRTDSLRGDWPREWPASMVRPRLVWKYE